jgi:imidazolonepropionase-like amidohydrolase/Tol biopolymer transport system component
VNRSAAIFAALLFAHCTATAQIVEIRQGTNISIAANANTETLIVDLLGGLWRLPTSGGGATMLLPPGSGAQHPRFNQSGSSVAVERRQGNQWDLWHLELATGNWTQLTDTPYNERQPDFLTGGDSVVFSGDRSGRYQLWTLDLGTLALRQLSDEPGANTYPSAGADGAIAYANQTDDQSTLRVLRGGPVGEVLATSAGSISAPSWRPGSRVLVYHDRGANHSELRLLIDADIRVLRRLTEEEDVFIGRSAWLDASEFVYASDGQLWRRRIASGERSPVHMFAGVSVERSGLASSISAMDEAGPHAPQGIRDLSWGPDGRAAVFTALGDLWLARGRSLRRLTQDEYVDVEPQLAPRGDAVIFVSDRGGGFNLWQLSLDSGSMTQLTDARGSVAQPVITVDGEWVYYVETAKSAQGTNASLRRTLVSEPTTIEIVAENLDESVRLSRQDGQLVVTRQPLDREQEATDTFALAAAVTAPVTDLGPLRLDQREELSWEPVTPDEPLVIQAGRLFDGIGNDYSRHVDIHVAGQRITAIVARGRLPLPARVMDFSESTVIPGLIDVHVHHPRNSGTEIGRAWLAYGVTTVREVDSQLADALERAESWASGARPGPRLSFATAGQAEGYTNINGGPIPGEAAYPISAGFRHVLDWQLAGHATASQAIGLNTRLSAGYEIALSPLNAIYQDTLALLDGTGTYLSTGLASAVISQRTLSEQQSLVRTLGETLARVQRSFARVAIGSDAPTVPYGLGFHQELRALADAGVANAQILRWATAGGAIALGLDQQLGTLEPGKLADFVVIDGDPLRVIGDTLNIEAVAKGGVFVNGAAAARR